MPEDLDFPEAAGLVISAGTAYEGLVDRGKLRPGETVLITAASGTVGSAAIQIAASTGARVFAVAGERSHDYVRGLGAEMVVDYRDRGFIEALRRAVPNGFDVLFDGTGNEVRDQAFELVRTGGRGIFIAGNPPVREGVEIHAFFATVDAARLQAVVRLVAEREASDAGRGGVPSRARTRGDKARCRAPGKGTSGGSRRSLTAEPQLSRV